MMDTDQMNYSDMIAEAKKLAMHIEEWCEQFPEHTEEWALTSSASSLIEVAIEQLQGAKQENADSQKSERNALLNRIKTGTTTSRDAILAERLMS